MIFEVRNPKSDMIIGVSNIPYRKKLCLVIREGNIITKYATFKDAETAIEFVHKLMEFIEPKEQNNE